MKEFLVGLSRGLEVFPVNSIQPEAVFCGILLSIPLIVIIAVVKLVRDRNAGGGRSGPISWGPAPKLDPRECSPERRYQMWRYELTEWTNTDGTSGGLEDLLERWRDVPHGKPKSIVGVDVANGKDEAVLIKLFHSDIPGSPWEYHVPENYESPQNSEFKVGQWVRRKDRDGWVLKEGIFLFQIVSLDLMTAQVRGRDGVFTADYIDIEPATPRKGEWWMWTACMVCKDGLSDKETWTFGPAPIEDDLHETHSTVKRAIHGCCVPYNYGLREEVKG